MKLIDLGTRYRAYAIATSIALLSLLFIAPDRTPSSAQRRDVNFSERGSTDDILSGTISGRVFQDYNGNGVYDTATGLNSIDLGVAGVLVTAYDGSNISRGTAITDSAGLYSITAAGTGPYRVEFTAIPAGFSPSARSRDSVAGATASDSGSTVHFVPNGSTSNVNLALERPEEYCQNNPDLVVSRFAEGAQNGTYAANAVLANFPYNSGTAYTDTTVANYDNPTTHTMTTQAQAIGTVYGMAYARSTNRLYAASFFKRHGGFGPGVDGTFNNADDPAAIYVVNPTNSSVTGKFSLPGATTNSHNTADYGTDNNDIGWDAVGKTSIGGIALAADDSRLFVMNLQNRMLYALNPATGASLGVSASATTLTLPTPGGTAANCAANDIRPMAVTYYRGKVYIGAVCSAESTASVNNLFAYIVQVDPVTLAFGPVVHSIPLNYTRGFADPGWAAEWQPWRPTMTTDFAAPQPMLASFEFDETGVILGLRDRAGDQEYDNGPDAKRTAGDTLRSCGAFGAWTLESNGRCGSPATGQAAQGTGQGPGNGEFYYQDDFCLTPNGANYHDEVAWGVVLHIPGRQDVVSTLLDPISRVISNGATFDGGLRWMNNVTGASDRAYRLYNGTGAANQPDFGKANGMGGLTALCSPAPIEIGNRVWRDANSNGVQDAGESGIAGVTVRLYNGSTAAGSAVTDANGEYYFVSSTVPDPTPTDNIGQVNGGILRSTNYQIRFDNPADYATGGPLYGLGVTLPNRSSQAGNVDSNDSDAVTAANPAGSPAGVFAVIPVTTGGQGANDHTLDAGFTVAPSAAEISVSGRALTSEGRGVMNVRISLILPDGTVLSTLTGRRGFYSFENVEGGQTVVIGAAARRFTFTEPTRVVNLTDNVTGLDFVAADGAVR